MSESVDISIKKIEELSSLELYEVLQKREEVFIVEQKCPYPDCDGKDIDSYHLICKANDQIVGYLRILPRGLSYEEVSIGRVLVDKGFRKHGYGIKIVQSAIDFIEKVLCEKKIRISAQLYLVDFYQSLGFKRIGNPYEEDWIPHTEMFYESI